MASKRGREGDIGESSQKRQRGSSSAEQCTFDVSDIHEEYTNATVHGMVVQLSLTKASKTGKTKYFAEKFLTERK